MEKIMQWIVVEDNSPDFEKPVLGYYTTNEGQVLSFCILKSIICTKEGNTFQWVDDANKPVNPTHWMSLPEFPQL